MANSVTWVIPLTVTVTVGEPQAQIEFEPSEEEKRFQNQLAARLDEIVEKTCERS